MFLKTLVSSGVLASLVATAVDAKYPLSPLSTGVNPTTGARPFRNNIIDLYQEAGPTWDLYIQALATMQSTQEDDLLSYFQISGIHGRPYYSWDGYEHNPDAPEIGYCTHGNVLFPTWHRPYLALFEKVLYDNAQKIAKTYTSNLAVYQAAADNFRMPYWDWPTIPTMPDAIILPTVKINTPLGQKEVTNPNFEYKFLNFPLNDTWFPSTSDNILSTYNSTKRSPFEGVSNNGAANNNLAGAGLMKDTYDVFAKITDFNIMATGNTAGLSFEYVHNKVHTGIGGGGGFVSLGHMSAVSYSSFDPVFWLHHTNVDRLFALWEAVNPTSFLTPTVDSTGTFTIPIGTSDTVSSPLTPFTMGDGITPFTSTTSRFTKDFGYAYPEILDWTMNEDDLKKNVTAWINTHWAPATTTKNRRRAGNVGRAGKESREWSVAIQALDTAFGKDRYIVEVSIKGQKIGEMQVVPPAAAMEGRAGNVNSTTNYEIDLDDALVGSGIDVEDVDAVTNFLKSGLEWNAKKSDSVGIPGIEIPGLVITVQDVLVTPAADITEFPHYGLITSHPEVTNGK